jgi:ABC-type amino acid transport substrate-binding protein
MKFTNPILLAFLLMTITVSHNFAYSSDDVGSESSNKINVVGNYLPPFGIEKDGKLAGLSVEMLLQLLDKSDTKNIDITFEHVSFARAFAQLENRKKTIALHFAKSAIRDKKFKWVGPYFVIRMGVVGMQQNVNVYPDFDSLKDNLIAVVNDTLLEDILLSRGFPRQNMVLISNPVSGLNMLNAGHIQLYAHIPLVLNYLMRQEFGVNAPKLEEKFPLQTGHFYFALSQDFDDEFVSNLQQLLNDMIDNNEFAQLFAKYQVGSSAGN